MVRVVKIVLTEVGKSFMAEHYPQGVIWEYSPDGEFTLKGVAAKFVEFVCPMGIPYRIPNEVGGEQTWRKADVASS